MKVLLLSTLLFLSQNFILSQSSENEVLISDDPSKLITIESSGIITDRGATSEVILQNITKHEVSGSFKYLFIYDTRNKYYEKTWFDKTDTVVLEKSFTLDPGEKKTFKKKSDNNESHGFLNANSLLIYKSLKKISRISLESKAVTYKYPEEVKNKLLSHGFIEIKKGEKSEFTINQTLKIVLKNNGPDISITTTNIGSKPKFGHFYYASYYPKSNRFSIASTYLNKLGSFSVMKLKPGESNTRSFQIFDEVFIFYPVLIYHSDKLIKNNSKPENVNWQAFDVREVNPYKIVSIKNNFDKYGTPEWGAIYTSENGTIFNLGFENQINGKTISLDKIENLFLGTSEKRKNTNGSNLNKRSNEIEEINEKNKNNNDDIETRLKKLKSLFDKGLINQNEYDQKRKEILENL